MDGTTFFPRWRQPFKRFLLISNLLLRYDNYSELKSIIVPTICLFIEVTDFIYQPAKEEAYRDRNKWFEQREKLKQYYRNKMRRNAMWVAGTAQQSQKKRPLVDGTDESSFQYFGQQEEIERQQKKKPHRTFFK